MKLKNYLMGLLLAVALAACSTEEVIQSQTEDKINGDARFMSVSIRNAEAPTRVGANYEDGIAEENKVKNIVFYFFNQSGDDINVINGDKNYFVCSGEAIKDEDGNVIDNDITGSFDEDNENVEKLLTTTIVLSNGNSQKDNLKDLYSIVAIVNFDGFLDPYEIGNQSLEELKGKVDDYAKNLVSKVKIGDGDNDILPVPNAYDDSEEIPYLVMTSSSYVADDGVAGGKTATFEVKNISDYVKDSETDAKASPVNIYVERLVAKVRLSTDWKNKEDIKDVTLDGDQVSAILLRDDEGAPYEVTLDGDTRQIYAVFLGWGLDATAQESRLFKKVGLWNLTGWGEDGYGWNNSSYCRSFWALNPSGVTAENLVHFRYIDANVPVGLDSFVYCQENAADDQDGTKSDYYPDEGITNRTQVLIRAKLVTLTEDKIATELSLAEWGGSKYTSEDVKRAMLATVNNDIYIRRKLTDSEDYEYKSIPENMVKLVSGIESRNWSYNIENDKRYLSYIMLENDPFASYEGYDKAFFTKKGEERFSQSQDGGPTLEADINLVNKKLLGVIGAKVWEDGKTYYYTDLKHLGKDKNKGLYGVVRNHIYDVKINSVTGLGTPVLNGEEVIIPQHPGQDAFFLGAQVNILSWRIVSNSIELNW